MIVDMVRSRETALAGVIGGGYSGDLDALADRYRTLHRAAAEFAQGRFPDRFFSSSPFFTKNRE